VDTTDDGMKTAPISAAHPMSSALSTAKLAAATERGTPSAAVSDRREATATAPVGR
jgi:hypothetical protein